MDEELAARVRGLLAAQRVAALATLHGGEPYASMTPFALIAQPARFVIHVSSLAAHTKDMLADPRVSLLVMAPLGPGEPAQSLARLTIQGDAARLEPESREHAAARAAYLARFPESEMTFGLGDFSLFLITPRVLRFVGGFAQAKSFTPQTLDAIVAAD